MKHLLFVLSSILVCFYLTIQEVRAQSPIAETFDVSNNNWYVGNTKAGEWIMFKKVWLSAGSYRFTTNAVASKQNQSVKLELNDKIIGDNVLIPSNTDNSFQYVHLGSTTLNEGYYDVKLTFVTGNVNSDMIFIRKSNNTGKSVFEDDTYYSIDRSGTAPLIAPIGGAIGGSSLLAKGGEKTDDPTWSDANGNPFTRKQVLLWNKQQMYTYTPEYTDQTMDYYVSEQVEAKVSFIFAHGRGDVDFENDIEDRKYTMARGGMSCRALKKLVNAINRSKYAKGNLKIAFFSDNAVYPLAIQDYLNETMDWANEKHQEFLWNFVIKPWYDNVPRDMLYEVAPNVVPLQLWNANSNYNYTVSSADILSFLQYMTKKMQETYGLTPGFVLDKNFFQRDARTQDYAYGVQAWFSWCINIVSMEKHKDIIYAFAFNGGRKTLRSIWLNDWDPVLDTGTSVSNISDCHIPSIDASGTPVIRDLFVKAVERNARWVVLESWCDWREGSTFYRSNHPEYSYPNQYISLIREFSDRNSESIVLESEACDEFYSSTKGNIGGAYRLNWYNDLDKDFWTSNKDVDLDVYRPLHKLRTFTFEGRPTETTRFKGVSVGLKDTWAFDENGKMYCHQADGIPANNWKESAKQIGVKDLSVSANYAWAITTDNRVMRSELVAGETNTLVGWVNYTSGIVMKDIDASLKEVWAIDVSGNVYYRDLSGKRAWLSIPGKLSSITADEQSVWGITLQGKIVRMSTESKAVWDTVPNPYNLIKIEAGSGEVWGVNAANEAYRKDASPHGNWELVRKDCKDLSIGLEFVWVQGTDENMYKYNIAGFENRSVFPNTDYISSIPESQENQLFNIYTNSTSLFIEGTSITDTAINTSIYDLLGNRVCMFLDNIETTHLKKEYNIGHLLKGIYIVKLSMGNNIKTTKILIE